MIEGNNIRGYYFVGIGGIGMSNLALYFLKKGFEVAGYDRTETFITRSLAEAGCNISYCDSVESIPYLFREASSARNVIVIYTPAIPLDNQIISWFRNNGYRLFKRAEILGELSRQANTVAVAGTHGKTTISTMTAHLLKQSHLDCSAFLGGISKNYGSNLISGESRFTVMEADEFDRSFHHLSPFISVVTSLDPDHLDIYGDLTSMVQAYNEFCSKTRKGGYLLVNSRIKERIIKPADVNFFTYGGSAGSDYVATGIRREKNVYIFDIQTPDGVLKNIEFALPGKVNVENLTAAIAVSLLCGVSENEIKEAAKTFKGVVRRFDVRYDNHGVTYIDDYAHHPEEIRAFIMSVKEYYAGRRITGIFQPHLYSRTRDLADGFASVLDELDEAVILPIYPARENPVPGVSSEMIFERMRSVRKRMLNLEDIPGKIDLKGVDILATIGAGNIDTRIPVIEKALIETFG